MIAEAITKIYAVALKHEANMSSILTQDGAAIFGETEGNLYDLDGYGIGINGTRKFAAVLSDKLQSIIEDEITEDWFAAQIRNMLLSPIGQPLMPYASLGANISNFFGLPASVSVALDGYLANVKLTP